MISILHVISDNNTNKKGVVYKQKKNSEITVYTAVDSDYFSVHGMCFDTVIFDVDVELSSKVYFLALVR